MSPETLFSLLGPPTLAGWAILILAPRRWAWVNSVPAFVIPAIFSALYAALVLTHFASTGGGYGTLAAVRQLMTSDWMLLAGWIHYLAFDMMIGAVMARRLDRVGLSRLLQAPLLVLIFLFGPAGFLLAYVTERAMSHLNKEPSHGLD